MRSKGPDGQVHVEKARLRPIPSERGPQPSPAPAPFAGRRRGAGRIEVGTEARGEVRGEGRAVRIYPYGISRDRLESILRGQRLPAAIVKEPDQADVVLTVKNYYRRKPQALREAESGGVPVYVVKSNTEPQIEGALINIFELETSDPASYALREAEDAVAQVLGGSKPVELSPQSSYIRRLQHQLAERHNLSSRSKGREPYRRVKISKTEE